MPTCREPSSFVTQITGRLIRSRQLAHLSGFPSISLNSRWLDSVKRRGLAFAAANALQTGSPLSGEEEGHSMPSLGIFGQDLSDRTARFNLRAHLLNPRFLLVQPCD